MHEVAPPPNLPPPLPLPPPTPPPATPYTPPTSPPYLGSLRSTDGSLRSTQGQPPHPPLITRVLRLLQWPQTALCVHCLVYAPPCVCTAFVVYAPLPPPHTLPSPPPPPYPPSLRPVL